MEDFVGRDRSELLRELKQSQNELEDVEEMRLFTLGQSGVHLGVGRLKSLQGSWDRDEARLRARIATIVGLLDNP